jgi:hypothetical protein
VEEVVPLLVIPLGQDHLQEEGMAMPRMRLSELIQNTFSLINRHILRVRHMFLHHRQDRRCRTHSNMFINHLRGATRLCAIERMVMKLLDRQIRMGEEQGVQV